VAAAATAADNDKSSCRRYSCLLSTSATAAADTAAWVPSSLWRRVTAVGALDTALNVAAAISCKKNNKV
jgi:hypothetical protein